MLTERRQGYGRERNEGSVVGQSRYRYSIGGNPEEVSGSGVRNFEGAYRNNIEANRLSQRKKQNYSALDSLDKSHLYPRSTNKTSLE